MIVQLSCHTIKSAIAQTFENAENADISQGWYVAALKERTAYRRGASCTLPGAFWSAQECTTPLNLGPWIFDSIALL